VSYGWGIRAEAPCQVQPLTLADVGSSLLLLWRHIPGGELRFYPCNTYQCQHWVETGTHQRQYNSRSHELTMLACVPLPPYFSRGKRFDDAHHHPSLSCSPLSVGVCSPMACRALPCDSDAPCLRAKPRVDHGFPACVAFRIPLTYSYSLCVRHTCKMEGDRVRHLPLPSS
jgi:hypothetical protein